jgi:hypothetical protein
MIIIELYAFKNIFKKKERKLYTTLKFVEYKQELSKFCHLHDLHVSPICDYTHFKVITNFIPYTRQLHVNWFTRILKANVEFREILRHLGGGGMETHSLTEPFAREMAWQRQTNSVVPRFPEPTVKFIYLFIYLGICQGECLSTTPHTGHQNLHELKIHIWDACQLDDMQMLSDVWNEIG